MKTRDAKILNNRMIKEDEGMFYRKTKGKNKRNRKTPKIEQIFGREFGKITPKRHTENG